MVDSSGEGQERDTMIGWDQGSDLINATVHLPTGWIGYGFVGLRLNVPNATTANVWGGPTLVRPLPLAPLAMSIVSSSANDTALSADGAQFAIITYIDASGDWRWSDLLSLNGLTPVAITTKPSYPKFTANPPFTPTLVDGSSVAASIFRVQSAAVALASGATQAVPFASNAGNLSVVDTATGLITYEYIPIDRGVSQTAAFHVPAGFEGLLTRWVAGTERGSGKVSLDANLAGVGAWSRVTFSSISSQTVIYPTDPPAVPIPSRTDFVATVQTGTNNVDVTTNLQLRLKPIP